MEVEKRLIKFVNEVEETLDFFKDNPNHVFDGNELAVDAIKHELEDLREWEEETAMEILNKKSSFQIGTSTQHDYYNKNVGGI